MLETTGLKGTYSKLLRVELKILHVQGVACRPDFTVHACVHVYAHTTSVIYYMLEYDSLMSIQLYTDSHNANVIYDVINVHIEDQIYL